MKPRAERVYRCDISTLRPVERRADGTILVDAFLSKCGVFRYMQRDGSIRRELRLREDVQDPESLRSFEGVPVTNNHPPGMVDATSWKQYAVGAQLITPIPDADHIRGRLSIGDAQAVQDMENGKIQVSNGYTCDCIEKPGVHPVYGIYDAIQKNIRGNHVAIVDRARAGITASARMDGQTPEPWQVGMMVLEPGMEIAVDATPRACKSRAMAQPQTARIEVVVKNDASEPGASAKVDPEDLANRNAAGATAAKKAAKEQPGESYEDGGNPFADGKKKKPDPDDDDEDDADDDDDDRDDASMYDDDRIAASTYALPGKKQFPIHSPEACKDSMKKFGAHEFDDANEAHGAFNRITGKAKQFGMNTSRFEAKHAGKLDRADGAHKDSTMSTPDIKALEEKAAKADKRKEKLVAARARIDSLEIELAEKDALIENMKRDAESAKTAPRADAEDPKKFEERVDAKVDLLDKARQTGAEVTSKMSDLEIKRAVVTRVDGKDVPEAKKTDASYVDALFDGALERSKKDAADTAKGADAIAAARAAVETTRTNTHLDASTDEDEAKSKLRAANRDMINQPSASARRAVR